MRRARFTILHKGLLMIGGPLVFQLLCIAMFLLMQTREKSAEQWLLHTRDVIELAEQTFRTLAQSFSNTRGSVLMGTAPPSTTAINNKVLRQIDDLRQLVIDNPPQVQRVLTYRAAADNLLQWIDQIDELLRQGHQADASAAISQPSGADRLDQIEKTLDAILEDERELSEARLDKLAATRLHMRWLLGISAITAAFLALAFLGAFARNIAGRMNLLAANAQAMGERRTLGPLLRGSDEIALVDRAFHHAGDQLAELAEAETRYRRELEQRAEELLRLNKDLSVKTRENETFVYSVSHDLRSPLVNLQGFSQELAHSCEELRGMVNEDSLPSPVQQKLLRVVDKDIREAVRFIQTAVSRAASIIDALLRLSRVGRVEYSLRDVSIAQIVARVIEAMQGTIRQRGAQIIVKDLPDACGDASAIEQIFGNLIGNAVNYLDPKRVGRIEVGSLPAASKPDGSGERPQNIYYAQDNGMGIPTAYLPKMFVAFQRLHGSLAVGEGIGLAMARRMVERHGGRIWVESQENFGSIFFVALPMTETKDTTVEPEPVQ